MTHDEILNGKLYTYFLLETRVHQYNLSIGDEGDNSMFEFRRV